jgi:hypothetical protein
VSFFGKEGKTGTNSVWCLLVACMRIPRQYIFFGRGYVFKEKELTNSQVE